MDSARDENFHKVINLLTLLHTLLIYSFYLVILLSLILAGMHNKKTRFMNILFPRMAVSHLIFSNPATKAVLSLTKGYLYITAEQLMQVCP